MYFSSFVFVSKSYTHTYLNVTHCTSISKFILCANYPSSSIYTLDIYWCANTHNILESTPTGQLMTFQLDFLKSFSTYSMLCLPFLIQTHFSFLISCFFFIYILFSCSFSPLINNWGTPVICFAVSCRNCIDVLSSTLFKQQPSHL